MNIKYAIGIDSFKELVNENRFFIDKTLFIKEFFEDSSNVMLITRPRRFGKTLNMSMLKHFADINEKDSARLFGNFKIW